MLFIADLTDGRMAGEQDKTSLSRRQSNLSVFALFRHQLSAHSGGSNKLSAFSKVKLDVVNDRSDRNRANRQTVSGPDVSSLARNDLVALFQVDGRKDVSLLAILILHQRNSAGAVGIVFDRENGARHLVLVSLEVDDAVHPFVSAAGESVSDASLVVSSARLLDRSHERFVWVDRLSLTLFFCQFRES